MAQGYSADNPPSFHSHVSSPPPGQMAYDGYDEVSQHGGPSRQGFRLDADDSYEPVRLESEYHARSEVDMELRLGNGHERSRTPAVRPGDRARGDAGTHVGFDEEDDGEEQQFEDSFEGNESGLWDEKRDYGEEEEIGSPAVSFVGGFGAPPPVREAVDDALQECIDLCDFCRRLICDETSQTDASNSLKATSSSTAPFLLVSWASYRARTTTSLLSLDTPPSPALYVESRQLQVEAAADFYFRRSRRSSTHATTPFVRRSTTVKPSFSSS